MRPSGIVLWTVRPTCAKLRFFAWPGESSGVYAPVSPCCSLVQREWRSWNVHKNKTKSCVAQCVYLFVAAFDTIVLCSLSCLVRVIQLVACACACAWLAHTLAHSHTHTLAPIQIIGRIHPTYRAKSCQIIGPTIIGLKL